ncbi:alpha/beta hydrolase [Fusibacter ferrireducens]|uniref:Alpha/beta hydrolase n=1 Tax=Fusibacter ferrireducens TaxID=2785058 RepID=A0ABR9ZN26_9FIRM|nr:alpha/beta hydrolase [Fusibacter ferrireducens]MBF4691518.1 alpha/beta hydrolase [Fusibacter ferrireducens]
MQSMRSRVVIWLLQHRHLFKLKLKPDEITEDFSVEKFREGIESATKRMEKPLQDVQIEAASIHGMNGEWIIPKHSKSDKAILYIHGGGFISGSCSSHRMHVTRFAKGSNVKALIFDYRLAPEHPHPAALDDSVSAYKWLLDQGYNSKNIVIMGESAGGTLTLSTLLALKSMHLELPKSAISISPVTDLSCSANSFIINAKKDIAPMNSWRVWTNYYVNEHDIKDPLLSPLYGDLVGLPPIYLTIGTHEIHFDDTLNFAKKAEASGVDVTLKEWQGMVHAFPILSPLFPEAQSAHESICDFVRHSLE